LNETKKRLSKTEDMNKGGKHLMTGTGSTHHPFSLYIPELVPDFSLFQLTRFTLKESYINVTPLNIDLFNSYFFF